jgi:glycosyltransferase involved in cell wall biosynthesis
MDIPVVCTDIPVLREVGGEGACYVDREDPAAVASQLHRSVTDPQARQQLVMAGQRNRTRFGWDRMAAETMAVYRRTCA